MFQKVIFTQKCKYVSKNWQEKLAILLYSAGKQKFI
jgi:hypothetical protein